MQEATSTDQDLGCQFRGKVQIAAIRFTILVKLSSIP